MGRQSNSYRGFTLLELMFVVAISGILASLGMASYSQMKKNYQVDQNGIDVESVLQIARVESALRYKPVTCTFWPNGIECFTRQSSDQAADYNATDANGDGIYDNGGGDVDKIVSYTRFDESAAIASKPDSGVIGGVPGVTCDDICAWVYFLPDGTLHDSATGNLTSLTYKLTRTDGSGLSMVSLSTFGLVATTK